MCKKSGERKKNIESKFVELNECESGSGTLSINHFFLCLCVLCSPVAVLHTDPDKFQVSVSICDGDVIHRAHLTRVCVCVCLCERVHFAHAGLGDNYSRDHLFSRMRYNNKRLREREDVRWRGEQDRGLEDS